jgi:hypothetical protein
MKPTNDAYLSEHMAARLAATAKRSGDTQSALVEAALDRFLGPDDDTDDNATLAGRLNGLSRQIENLDRDLRILNETVALHARFHMAVTPPLPAAILRAACELGSRRFEEFAAQVERRIHLGTPLMRETLDRLDRAGEGERRPTTSTSHEPPFGASTEVGKVTEHTAAVRGDGSFDNFPGPRSRLLH